MEQQGNQNQFRFLMAAVLSMLVLFGWSYFFAPQPPAGNSNVATSENTNTSQPAGAPAPATPQPVAQPGPQVTVAATDTAPNRSVTIKSPLYEVTLDSKGAVATSWILLKNISSKSEYPLYAD